MQYIEFKGVEVTWGSVGSGMRFQQARDNLVALEHEKAGHTKNWRLQMLLLSKIHDVEDLGVRVKMDPLRRLGQRVSKLARQTVTRRERHSDTALQPLVTQREDLGAPSPVPAHSPVPSHSPNNFQAAAVASAGALAPPPTPSPAPANPSCTMETSLMRMVAQLQNANGLTMVGTMVFGNMEEHAAQLAAEGAYTRNKLQQYELEAFPECVSAEGFQEGVRTLVQCAGLGQLRPNMVVLGWPGRWREDVRLSTIFVESLKEVAMLRKGILLLKMPPEISWPTQPVTGTIDAWWLVQDGGLLLLLPVMLQRCRHIWGATKLRVFSLAELNDNSVRMEQLIKEYIYNLRINATVEIVELAANEVLGSNYEVSLEMTQRQRLVQRMDALGRGRGWGHLSRMSKEAVAELSVASTGSGGGTHHSGLPVLPPNTKEGQASRTSLHATRMRETYNRC